MKITIEHYDTEVSYKLDDGADLHKMCEVLTGLLRCIGYCFDGELQIVDDGELTDKIE